MYLLAPPTIEPVSVSDAALAARLSAGDALEPMLAGLIASAREIAEQETGQRLMQQTWRAELADWPAADDVLHFNRPTAAAVSYWTGSAWSALDTSWPTLGRVAGGPRVRIDLTGGATDAAQVRECAKLFIKALVAHWVDNPEAASARTMARAPFLGALLDPLRFGG